MVKNAKLEYHLQNLSVVLHFSQVRTLLGHTYHLLRIPPYIFTRIRPWCDDAKSEREILKYSGGSDLLLTPPPLHAVSVWQQKEEYERGPHWLPRENFLMWFRERDGLGKELDHFWISQWFWIDSMPLYQKNLDSRVCEIVHFFPWTSMLRGSTQRVNFHQGSECGSSPKIYLKCYNILSHYWIYKPTEEEKEMFIYNIIECVIIIVDVIVMRANGIKDFLYETIQGLCIGSSTIHLRVWADKPTDCTLLH